MKKVLLAFVLSASVASTMTEGRALAAPQVDDATSAALKKFDSGRTAFEQGKFEEALLSFQASNSLVASPNAKLYIGRCYRALGKVASAFTSLRMAGREAQDRMTATGEKRYGATRDAALAEAAEIEPKVPRLTLAIPSDTPDGFTVKKNGVEVPKEVWGVAIETDPGELVIEASGPRLAPFKTTVKLTEGEQGRVDVKATRLPTATIALHLGSRPSGMTIEVDKTAIDISAAEAVREVDVGNHEVIVQAPGFVPFRWKKALANADKEVVEVRLQPDRSAIAAASSNNGTPKWLFFGVAGAAVASVAVGSIIALDAKSAEDDELAKSPFDRTTATRDSIQSASTTANVLFIAGGALAVGATVLAFTTQWKSPQKTRSETSMLSPWFSPNGAGIGAHGSF